MSNSLTTHNKMNLNAPSWQPVAQDLYRPSLRRAMCGITGIAMATITIAVSVILPAQTTPERDSRVLEASESTQLVPKDLITLASVTVVAARDPGSRAIVRESGAVQ